MTMKMVMVSYSMTGNNDALAANIAAELGIERVRITEPKVRTSARIALDMLLDGPCGSTASCQPKTPQGRP